jgi:hypothetical protein
MPRLKADMLRLHVHCDIERGDMDIITSPHRVFMKELYETNLQWRSASGASCWVLSRGRSRRDGMPP